MLAGLKLKRTSIFNGQTGGTNKSEVVENLREKASLSEGSQ